MAKKCQLKKKEQEMRKCFKYDKEEYIAKDCKEMQSIKSARFMKNRTMKTERKDRVLAMILSRHGIRDLPCKFPK